MFHTPHRKKPGSDRTKPDTQTPPRPSPATSTRRSFGIVGKALSDVVHNRKLKPISRPSSRLAKAKDATRSVTPDPPQSKQQQPISERALVRTGSRTPKPRPEQQQLQESPKSSIRLAHKRDLSNISTKMSSTPTQASAKKSSQISPVRKSFTKVRSDDVPTKPITRPIDMSPTAHLRKASAGGAESSSESSITRTGSLHRQASASPSLIRRMGHLTSPSTTSVSTMAPSVSTQSSGSSSRPMTSPPKSSSPTLGRKAAHASSPSTSSTATITAISVPTKLKPTGSALPQPKARAKAPIASSSKSPLTGPLASTKRIVRDEDDWEKVSTSDGRASAESKREAHTPSPERPLSPMPKRARASLSTKQTILKPTTSGSRSRAGSVATSDTSNNVFTVAKRPLPSFTVASALPTRQPVTVTVTATEDQTTTRPRFGFMGMSKSNAPPSSLSNGRRAVTTTTGLLARVPERTPSPEVSSISAPKRRKSDNASSLFAATHRREESRLSKGPRLSVPTNTNNINNNASGDNGKHLQPPKTPASTARTIPLNTFSIPRNRIISFTFADMAMPDIPDDDGSLSFEVPPTSASSDTTREGEDDDEEQEISSLLPTIFSPLPPPTQSSSATNRDKKPSLQSYATPSKSYRNGSAKKKRPGLRPIRVSTNERQSILTWDAMMQRSRNHDHQAEEDDLDAMLSEIPAPFTPGRLSSGVSPASSVYDGGFAEDGSVGSGPPSPLDGMGGQHHSIAQMLFPFPHPTFGSGSTAPSSSSAATSEYGGQAPSSSDVITEQDEDADEDGNEQDDEEGEVGTTTMTKATETISPTALFTQLETLRLKLASYELENAQHAHEIRTLEADAFAQRVQLDQLRLRSDHAAREHAAKEVTRCFRDVTRAWDDVKVGVMGEIDVMRSEREALGAILEGLAVSEVVLLGCC